MSIQTNCVNTRIFRNTVKVPWHPNLVELYIYCEEKYGVPEVQSAHRDEKVHSNDSGIHRVIPLRALDWLWTHITDIGICQAIESSVNSEWVYDPQRTHLSVCKWHTVNPLGRTGWHFHIQVHDRTVRKKEA